MLIVSILAFFVAIFLMASISVTVAWMAFLKNAAEESDAARRDQEAGDEDSPLFRSQRLSTLNFWDSVLARFDFIELLKERIAQADLDWSVGRVTAGMLLSGTIALAVLLKFLAGWAALLGALLIASIPYGYILHRRQKRFRKFAENFPDVLDSLSRALRAGYPLSASMEMISAETLPPVSTEMRKTSAEANLGMGWPQALEDLGRRVPLLEVNLFIAAVQLHSRTGGKLSEVLSGLAENMREGISLQGEVRSMAAHGKLTGIILTVLPIGIAIMMLIVSPGYMQTLFNHPYGKNLITAAVVCLVLAQLIIRKIVDIKV
ncbi:MAG TPA: type II secretion system F family protein [Bryobacteraceae bacterium]|nr:type II secretion system F family protein [Bryobacteraceae bacterium]